MNECGRVLFRGLGNYLIISLDSENNCVEAYTALKSTVRMNKSRQKQECIENSNALLNKRHGSIQAYKNQITRLLKKWYNYWYSPL